MLVNVESQMVLMLGQTNNELCHLVSFLLVMVDQALVQFMLVLVLNKIEKYPLVSVQIYLLAVSNK